MTPHPSSNSDAPLNLAKIDRAVDCIATQALQAERPIVLSSFGKDSMVLLDLCRQVTRMPVLFFVQEAQTFPEKYAHAWSVIQAWDLECYSLPPQWTIGLQHGATFDVYQGYGSPQTGTIVLSLGARPRRLGEDRFLCAAELIRRPVEAVTDYPWDVTFLGHKACDAVPMADQIETDHQTPITQMGRTRMVLPLWDWTDADVWAYIRARNLPYDRQRYEAQDETVNPDRFPTCAACLDPQTIGRQVYCPLAGKEIPSQAHPVEWHDAMRTQLLGAVRYGRSTVDEKPAASPTRVRFLDLQEVWPLWTMRKRIFGSEVWVQVTDLVDVRCKADGPLRVYDEWRRMEYRARRAGLAGWVAHVATDNDRFRRWMQAVGAEPYATDETGTWMQKRLRYDTEQFPTLRALAKTVREVAA